MKSGKLLTLYIRAKDLQAKCPLLDFQLCVGLILHGNMYSLRVKLEGEHFSSDTRLTLMNNDNFDVHRFDALDDWGLRQRRTLPVPKYQTPYIEMLPKEVAELHRRFRNYYGFTKEQGRPMDKETEVLGIAAIQLVWQGDVKLEKPIKYVTKKKIIKEHQKEYTRTYNVAEQGVSSFGKSDISKIREQYKMIAPFYGLDPDYFHVRKRGRQRAKVKLDSIRKILERLNQSYYEILEKLEDDRAKVNGVLNNKISLFTPL